MAWRYHGRARVNPSAPSAFGVCDRCGFLYNLRDLQFQFDWRGARLTNLKMLVSHQCYDKPQEQLRPIVLPPDPVPVMNSRPESYATEDAGIPIEDENMHWDEANMFWDQTPANWP